MVISAFAQSSDSENMKVWAKYDFVPGDKIIFEDNQQNEITGEFPSKWKLKRGGAETMRFADSSVIGFIAVSSEIEPLMKTAVFLPEIFTIEFDVYFHHKGNEGYSVIFDV